MSFRPQLTPNSSSLVVLLAIGSLANSIRDRGNFMRLVRVGQRSLLCAILVAGFPLMANAAGKVQLYALRMTPTGQDASRFSRPSWGGGLAVIVPFPQVHNLLAGVVGFEAANMLNQTTEFQDGKTGLRVEQQTSQDYYRLYLGGRVGPHGPGLIRPHVGSNVALVIYNIHTDVVVPGDVNRENEIRQNLRSRTESGFGWDLTFGTDFNIKNKWAVEGGVRFLKTFGVPQQLGAGSMRVEPAYFQIYLGLGLGFGAAKH